MDKHHSLPELTPNRDAQVSDSMKAGRLQIELELLRGDYKKLLAELFERKATTDSSIQSTKDLQKSVSTLIQSLHTLKDNRDQLQESEDESKSALADKESIISEQNRKIQSLYEQVDFLNVRLSEIYASEGYKFLSFLYKIRNALLPVGSSRQRLVKKIVNRIRGKKSDTVVIKDHFRPAGLIADEVVSFDPFSFPFFSNPRVSIVIPAYNGWKMNYLCLRSIWENTESVSYEVIFADDVSTDETQNVSNYIKNIRHIRNTENLGFLKNANNAAAFANGEFIHFLNNDTKVTPGWLSSLVSLMDTDKTIGLAGSKLVYPDGRLQEAGGIIWQDASGWNYGHKQDPDASEYNYVKEVDYISGASILVRKSLWDELGGFDTRYCPAYAEDSDLAFAVREKGYKVVYQPLSKVIHYEGFSHGTEVSPDKGSNIKSYQKINNGKFSEKWDTVLQQQFPNGVNPFWTRDRSHHKPTIVVIDHYVPHFDKDAGSRTTFQYLELFVELGMNVKFIGDNFYRHEPYTTVLQQKGIEVFYGSYYAENWLNWLKDHNDYIDFIFLNRPHVSIKYVQVLKDNLKAKIFYYTHDLHFHRFLMEYQINKDPEKLKSSAQWKETEYAIFRKSDVLLTPSGKEKDIVLQDFPDKPIEVMPAFFYPSIADAITDFSNRKDILFVGGFTHTPNVDAVLWFANEIFPVVREKNPDIRFIVVGSNAPELIQNLSSPSIIVKGFVSDDELDQLYKSVRLAVIPLRFGAGLKGKTVESLVKGLPIVSTSFGIEGMEAVDAVAQPYDSAEAFGLALSDLYDDIPKLEELSRAAVDYSKKYFTKDSAAVFFKQLFKLS
jgi:GT2 family glycosyltransferase